MGNCVEPNLKGSVYKKNRQASPMREKNNNNKSKEISDYTESKPDIHHVSSKSRITNRKHDLPDIHEEEEHSPKSSPTVTKTKSFKRYQQPSAVKKFESSRSYHEATVKKPQSFIKIYQESTAKQRKMELSQISEILGKNHSESQLLKGDKLERDRSFQLRLEKPRLESYIPLTRISDLEIDFHIQPPHCKGTPSMEEATFREEGFAPNKPPKVTFPSCEEYFFK